MLIKLKNALTNDDTYISAKHVVSVYREQSDRFTIIELAVSSSEGASRAFVAERPEAVVGQINTVLEQLRT